MHPSRAYGRGVLLDLLLPERCVACGRGGVQLCDRCLAALVRLRAPLCDRCGAPTAWPVRRCVECSGRRLAFAHARAAVVYDDVGRAFVAAWKEHGLRRLAEIAAETLTAAVEPPEVDLVTYVAADRDRTLKRTQHTAEALAHGLAQRWGLPVEPLLRRGRASRRQRGLTLAERRRNVRGAFEALSSPRRLALVDDVYTSGATASAAASALRRGGARRVEVITFARAVR
jgi:predicted amidophosphoribosyltransferase